MNLDDLKLSDDQKLKIDAYVKEQRAAAEAAYIAKAQRFRTWLRKQDQVWVAQRVASTIIAVEAVVAFAVWYWMR